MDKLENFALDKKLVESKAEMRRALSLVKETIVNYMKEAPVDEELNLSGFMTIKKVKYKESERKTNFRGKENVFKINTKPRVVVKFTKSINKD